MRRGQTSTEYLIILAVVVVIALIVISVLGGIPGIGRSTGERASAAYWSNADVGISAYSVADDSSNDDVTLVIRNNLRNAITVTSITLDSTVITSTSTTLATGGSTTITNTTAGDLCSAGNSFSFDTTIVYTDTVTGASYSFTGDGTKLEGTCAQ